VTVFQEVPPSPEELAKEAGVEPAERDVEAEEVPIGPGPAAERDVEAEEVPIGPGPAAEPEPPEPTHTTAAVRQEYEAGRLVAIEIEEDGNVTRIVREGDGWSVQ
jgi:hypothetical protein